MNSKTKLLTVLMLCFHLITKAQSDTLELSLVQAMAYATEFGYQSINAQHDIEIAKKKVRETLAIGLPQITGSGAFAKNLLIQEIAAEINGEMQRFRMGTDYSSSFGGRLDQLIFDGSYLVGLKASKIYVQLSENAKEKTDIELKDAVAQAYFLTLVAQQNIKNLKINLDTNEKTLKDVTAYYKNGLREDIDVDQVKLMVNQSKNLYLDAQRQYAVAKTVLKFAMGYDIDKPLKISDSLDDLIATISLNEKKELDILSHIDAKVLATQINVQDLDIKNQMAQALPKLYAFANYDYTMFGNELSDLYNTDAAAIGLSLSIPIFSSGMRSAQLKQKKIALKKLNVEKQMLEQSLKQDYMIAKTNLINAKEQYNNARLSEEIADRIYQKSLLKFENGMMNSLELSENERRKIEALLNFSQASTNYYNMYIQFQKATSQL